MATTKKVAARLSGPFFEPKHSLTFKGELVRDLIPLARAIEGDLKRAAPVDTGALKESIAVEVVPSKPKGRQWIAVRASASASRRATKGREPYGAFVDFETGFFSDAMEKSQGAVMQTLRASTERFFDRLNGSRGR